MKSSVLLLIVFCLQPKYEVQSVSAGIESRIVEGIEAAVQQFNYMLAIQVHTPTTRFFCGGGMLNQLWAITSANCVYEAVHLVIQLGSPILEGEDSARHIVETSTYYIHPDFNPTTIEHDLAIIRLIPAVSYTLRIGPVHFPAEDYLVDGIDVLMLGWGQISDSDSTLSNNLRYANGTVMSNAECRMVYGNALTDNMACVKGNEEKQGICIGDNGGPLVVYANRRNNVMGVASFVSGNGCENNDPSGFTRTWPYIEWLRNVTNI